ncbi:MAG: 4-hydroxy-3-methylbut-2-enyl diphosphate reductase [Bacteroidales bacterium]|nr:4-hydroxy-3-methylbut-2-enyl diphosphate reductase [Bacteroidales bacterium]
MTVEIDSNSGFCFGVINAINTAENFLATNKTLYCLGDIVHNSEEVNRLVELGLVIISHEEFKRLHDTTVLIRAHGEPPETYAAARERNITLIDATCQVVLRLQKSIKQSYQDPDFEGGQILIFGKKGHAEVIGLLGQTEQRGIVISTLDDLKAVDFSKPARLYSQTTQSPEEYAALIKELEQRYAAAGNSHLFQYKDTICGNVANRSKQIREFAARFDKIIFVSGEKSSNGLHLFHLCKTTNPSSHFISNIEQIKEIDVKENDRIGICGATSTPMWLMRKVKERLLDSQEKNHN